jgi:hypothetical protein
MAIVQHHPKTPTQRFSAVNKLNLWKGVPENSLVMSQHRFN